MTYQFTYLITNLSNHKILIVKQLINCHSKYFLTNYKDHIFFFFFLFCVCVTIYRLLKIVILITIRNIFLFLFIFFFLFFMIYQVFHFLF